MTKRYSCSIAKAVCLPAAAFLLGSWFSAGCVLSKTVAKEQSSVPQPVGYTVLRPSDLGIFLEAVDVAENGVFAVVAGLEVSEPDWNPPVSVAEWRVQAALLSLSDFSVAARLSFKDASTVRSMQLSPQGDFLAVALAKDGPSPVIEVFRIPAMLQVAEFAEGSAGFRFASEGILAIPSRESALKLTLWDYTRAVTAQVSPASASEIEGKTRLAVAPRAGLAAVSGQEEILVWKLGQPTPIARMKHELNEVRVDEIDLSEIVEAERHAVQGSSGIAALEFSSDGRLLGSVRNLYMATVERHGELVEEKDFAQRADITIWDATRGTPVASFRRTGPIRLLSFFPNGKWVAAAFQQSIQIIDAEDGRVVASLSPRIVEKGIGISALQVSADGKAVLAASADGMMHMWQLAQRRD